MPRCNPSESRQARRKRRDRPPTRPVSAAARAAPTEARPETRAAMIDAVLRARLIRQVLTRRIVLRQRRVDLFGSCILGYDLRPFHVDLLRFQDAGHRALLLAPRGYGKSTTLNITRVIFEVIADPDLRVLIVSNTQLQAEVFLREIKYHLEHNAELRDVFGNYVGEMKWDVREVIVEPRRSHAKESTISCVGVGGPVVSRHYDLIIADDLIDEDNARTEGQREKVRSWFYRSLLPTLEPDGRIYILGTRYHFLDLYGRLVEGEYRDRHKVVKALPDDGTTPWPEKFTVEWLQNRRIEMGTVLFNGQYQNDVQAMKGAIFRADWLRHVDTAPDGLAIYMGVDLAISRRETADYFAVVTVGVDHKTRELYVLDAIQRRLTFKQQTDLIVAQYAKWRPVRVAIEGNAYQAAQVEAIKELGYVTVSALTTTKDKVTRFLRLAAKFEAGRVFLRRGATEDLVDQLLLVPDADHDDLVDALDFAVSDALTGYLGPRMLFPVFGPDRSVRMPGIDAR